MDIARLFSNIVTLEKDGVTGQIAGPSFLMEVLLSKEASRFKGNGCISTERISMVYGDAQTAGIYKLQDIKSDDPLYELVRVFGRITQDGGIPVIRRDFQNCTGSVDFFYIPLTLIPVPEIFPRHANAILVSKSKGTYFRIEPEHMESELEDPKIQAGIEKALNEIGLKSPTQVALNTTCPQSLAKDNNCIFWSAYLSREVLRNMFKNQDPNVTIKQTGMPNIEAFKVECLKSAQEYVAKNGLVWKEQKGGVYWPLKYYRGLTRKQNLQRKRSATRRTKMSFKDPKAYVPFKTDKGVKTRKSSYTERFHKKYPGATSLPEIAKATGISKSILQKVYDRGMAAWRTGHRPGASQHAWGMARVHSFAMKGKTWRTADADLARKI